MLFPDMSLTGPIPIEERAAAYLDSLAIAERFQERLGHRGGLFKLLGNMCALRALGYEAAFALELAPPRFDEDATHDIPSPPLTREELIAAAKELVTPFLEQTESNVEGPSSALLGEVAAKCWRRCNPEAAAICIAMNGGELLLTEEQVTACAKFNIIVDCDGPKKTSFRSSQCQMTADVKYYDAGLNLLRTTHFEPADLDIVDQTSHPEA